MSEREIVAQNTATSFEAWIECDGRWQVEPSTDWVQVLIPGGGKNKGNGSARITISLRANPGTEDRSARLRFFTATDEDHIRIIQHPPPPADPPPPEPPQPFITPPVVTTLPATAITATSALIAMSYDYPFSQPAIAQVGLMWRPDDSDTYPAANRITSPILSLDTLRGHLTDLRQQTRYRYRGYVTTDDGKSHYGTELLLTTAQGYHAPTPVARFEEDFSGGASDWHFGPGSGDEGWLPASDAALGRHLMCYPVASPSASVVAYAMLPPLDVSAATTKRLHWRIAYDYIAADASRLEIVISDNFEGDFERATWQVLQEITLRPGLDARGTWIDGQSDLTALAHHTRLFMAFRYRGKNVCYRLGSVAFGTSGKGNDPPPPPAIRWGTPSISVAGGDFEQHKPSSATLRFPYSDNPTAQNIPGVSVTPAGIAAEGFAPLVDQTVSLTGGSGELLFHVSGTPTTPGQVYFVVAGVPGLTSPHDRVAAGVAAAPVTPPDPPPGGDPPVTPPGDNPIPFRITWNFGAITGDNWMHHTPVCQLLPDRSADLLVVENLTQHGGWVDASTHPENGLWGGNGFEAQAESASAAKYITLTIRCDTRRINLSSLTPHVVRSPAGPPAESLYYALGNGSWTPCTNDLSATPALQNIPAATPVGFKIVPHRAASPTGTWHLSSLSITGAQL